MGADKIAEQLIEVLISNGEEPYSSSSSSSSSSNDRMKNLEKWNDELECQLLAANSSSTQQQIIATESTSTASTTLKQAANILQSCILTTAIPSFASDIKNMDSNDDVNNDNDDDEGIKSTIMQIVSSFAEPNNNNDDCTIDLYLLASLLRAAGLFMRWYAVLQQQQQQSTALSENNNNNIMARLKCDGMLLLYSILLLMDIDCCINMGGTVSDSSSSSTTYPDVPRYASICIFRATYGNDPQSTTARQQFVNKLDGCHYLMKALLKGGNHQPVSRLFSVVRNVHHLIATCPNNEAISKMEKSLEELTTIRNDDEEEEDDGSSSNADGDEEQQQTYYGLSEVLITTLAWAYRGVDESDPPFPGVQSDRRSDLVLEILRALYVLGSTTTTNHRHNKPSHTTTMTQIGIILCELLQLSSADERVYNIKLAVVALLLNAPKEYSTYLVNNNNGGSIEALVDILSYQTSLVVVERSTGSSSEDAAAVVPILLVLLNLVQSNKIALDIIKKKVFPPGNDEEIFQQLATAEISKGQTTEGGKVNAKNMAPLNAPPKGTLRWKLIRLMTWTTESNIKRSACELLYALCDEDSTQFVLRTGFGNAVHFLGIRGQVNLPAGVDI